MAPPSKIAKAADEALPAVDAAELPVDPPETKPLLVEDCNPTDNQK